MVKPGPIDVLRGAILPFPDSLVSDEAVKIGSAPTPIASTESVCFEVPALERLTLEVSKSYSQDTNI